MAIITEAVFYIFCRSLVHLELAPQNTDSISVPLFIIIYFISQLFSLNLLTGIILYDDHGNISLIFKTTFLVIPTCYSVLHRVPYQNYSSIGNIRAESRLQVQTVNVSSLATALVIFCANFLRSFGYLDSAFNFHSNQCIIEHHDS